MTPFQWFSNLRLGDEKVTLNHLEDVYFLLKMGIFHCYVSLLEGITTYSSWMSFCFGDFSGSTIRYPTCTTRKQYVSLVPTIVCISISDYNCHTVKFFMYLLFQLKLQTFLLDLGHLYAQLHNSSR